MFRQTKDPQQPRGLSMLSEDNDNCQPKALITHFSLSVTNNGLAIPPLESHDSLPSSVR